MSDSCCGGLTANKETRLNLFINEATTEVILHYEWLQSLQFKLGSTATYGSLTKCSKMTQKKL